MTSFERGFLKRAAVCGYDQAANLLKSASGPEEPLARFLNDRVGKIFPSAHDTLLGRDAVMSGTLGGGGLGMLGGGLIGGLGGYHFGKNEKDPSQDRRRSGALLGGLAGAGIGAAGGGALGGYRAWDAERSKMIQPLNAVIDSLHSTKAPWYIPKDMHKSWMDDAARPIEAGRDQLNSRSWLDVLLRKPFTNSEVVARVLNTGK